MRNLSCRKRSIIPYLLLQWFIHVVTYYNVELQRALYIYIFTNRTICVMIWYIDICTNTSYWKTSGKTSLCITWLTLSPTKCKGYNPIENSQRQSAVSMAPFVIVFEMYRQYTCGLASSGVFGTSGCGAFCGFLSDMEFHGRS